MFSVSATTNVPPSFSLKGHDCSVRSMTWSHNGVWMTSTDDRGFVKYWQANLNNVHTFQAHNDPVRSSRWDSRRWVEVHVVLMCEYLSFNLTLFSNDEMYFTFTYQYNDNIIIHYGYHSNGLANNMIIIIFNLYCSLATV